VAESQAQVDSMRQFLQELTSIVTKQLMHMQAHSEEGLRVAHAVQEFSINFFNGEGDARTAELGHCTAMVGSMIRAVHGIFEPKLKAALTKILATFNQVTRSFQDHAELRASLAEAKARMDDLNERLMSAQKRGKVDLVKLSELQQERDQTTAKCRRVAEDVCFASESLRQAFVWQCLEQFGDLVQAYREQYHSGVEFVDALGPKVENWRRQAAAVKAEQQERSSAAAAASTDGKVTMSNGMLQLFANTEQQFIGGLRGIVQNFMASVLKDGSLFADMSKEDVQSIFGGIPPVLELHTAMFKRLVATQSVVATFDEARLAMFCQSYDHYLAGFCESQDALHRCKKKSKAFSTLLQSLETEAKAPLVALLASPMTRITEYVTFFEGLSQQKTAATGLPEDSQYILRVVELMKELAIAAEQVRSRNQVCMITKTVAGWAEADAPQPPERRFVMEMPVVTQQGAGRAFLFSDLILVARKHGAILSGASRKHQFVASMAIATTTPREIGDDNPQGLKNAVELTDIKQNLIVPLGFETEEQRSTFAIRVRSLRFEADQNKVFGVDLAALMASKREKGREIPAVLEDTVEALIADALDLEGLFRISASNKEMDEIRAKLDTGQPVQFGTFNGHVVAGILKLWIRSLPEPLLTFQLHDEFSSATKDKPEADAVRAVRAAIDRLPRANKACLHRLVTFLSLVEQNSAKNKMNAKNLSIVFSPQLLRSRKTQSMLNFADMSSTTFDCVSFMIEHCRDIFDEWVAKKPAANPPQSKRLAVALKAPLTGLDVAQAEIDLDALVDDDGSTASEATLSLRDIVRQGPLAKNREKWSNTWDQRWVIVKKGWLYHFRSQKDTKGGVINLQGAAV
jgi:hypothetical protein